MSFQKLLSISKPILYEVDSSEYPYSGEGTCFLVKHKSIPFLVTAKHVLKGIEANSLLVFPNKDSAESIPFNLFVHISNVNTYDSDYGDVTVLRIDKAELNIAENSSMELLDLDLCNNSWKNVINSGEMIFFGYPNESREVDYDNYRVISNQKSVTGFYLSKSNSNNCHEMKINDVDDIKNLNGFSGSPVFLFENLNNNIKKTHFCGMLIRGTVSSKKVTFIESDVIYNIINKI